ncbi:N-acetylmuramoyl-L-alanine amidase [Clostridium sp. DL1XJH146]
MRKRYNIAYILIFVFIFTSIFNNFSFAAENYTELSAKTNVQLNKGWDIKFNFDVDMSCISDDHQIIILDENNTYISIKRELVNSKQVKITPTYGYEYATTYTLIVRNTIKSTKGTNLKNESRMKFTTVDNPLTTTTPTTTTPTTTTPTTTTPTTTEIDYVVCLDAGRAGNDVGNEVGPTGVKGKDVNLSVALKAGTILEEAGFKVVYTRESDTVSWSAAESIGARSAIVNENNSDLLVSIHTNSWSTTASGSESYYLEESPEGKELASLVQKEFEEETTLPNRGTTAQVLKTLNTVDAVAIYTNLGFITNPTEEKVLASSSFQNMAAKAIAEGVMKYYETYHTEEPSNTETTEELFSEYPIDDDNSVSNVEDFSLIATQGKAFSLPKYVVVTNSKGQMVRASVNWTSPSVNTSEAGLQLIKGTTKSNAKEVVMALQVLPTSIKNIKVTIDPGHGGYDPGAIGASGVKEKDVVLPVALKVANTLIKNGVEVVFTRMSDNVPWPSNKSDELAMRCSISNNANANYFISIHANSMGSTSSVSGVETFYYYGRTDSAQFAANVNNSLYKAIGSVNRGVKERGFYVNHYVDAPSILTELEFLSNSAKEQLLKTDAYQQKCADAISAGILETIN